MAWETSNRKARLPADWPARRARVMNRDNWSCQWRYPNGGRCGAKANQCDHIDPKGGDGEENLRALCDKHHAWKSSSEGGNARAQQIKRLRQLVARPSEPQPGAIAGEVVPLKRRGF